MFSLHEVSSEMATENPLCSGDSDVNLNLPGSKSSSVDDRFTCLKSEYLGLCCDPQLVCVGQYVFNASEPPYQ